MYLRRGSILLIFLLFIPLAFSFDFQCRDGTLFGKCNEKSEICANGPNLIFRENVNLEESENYLFFSEVNSDCNVYELNLSSVVRLDKTDKTLVKEFSLNDSYDGKVRLLCDGFEIPLGNAYIGKLNNEIGLYNDIYYCGISQDFLDSFQKYLNANGEEREKLKEEMRDKFGLSSSYFRSITGNVVAEGKCVDFVENGRVDYDDFFLFSDNFGLTSENENFEDKFDLDSDNIISVEDFFIFADEFGNEVECGGLGYTYHHRTYFNGKGFYESYDNIILPDSSIGIIYNTAADLCEEIPNLYSLNKIKYQQGLVSMLINICDYDVGRGSPKLCSFLTVRNKNQNVIDNKLMIEEIEVTRNEDGTFEYRLKLKNIYGNILYINTVSFAQETNIFTIDDPTVTVNNVLNPDETIELSFSGRYNDEIFFEKVKKTYTHVCGKLNTDFVIENTAYNFVFDEAEDSRIVSYILRGEQINDPFTNDNLRSGTYVTPLPKIFDGIDSQELCNNLNYPQYKCTSIYGWSDENSRWMLNNQIILTDNTYSVSLSDNVCIDNTPVLNCSRETRGLYCTEEKVLVENCNTCSCTCFDEFQNQGESGVDCGGPCNNICEGVTDIESPVIEEIVSPKIGDIFHINDLFEIVVRVTDNTYSGENIDVIAIINDESVRLHSDDDKKTFRALWNEESHDEGEYHIMIIATDKDGNEATYNENYVFFLREDICFELIDGHNNPEEDRYNLVFVATNFEELDPFIEKSLEAIDFEGDGNGILSVEPYASNKDLFNFWYVPILTSNPITSNWIFPAHSEESFHSRLIENQISALSFCNHPNKKGIFLVDVNFRSFAEGLKFTYISTRDSDFQKISVHEFSHLYGLDDEYIEDRSNYAISGAIGSSPNCHLSNYINSCGEVGIQGWEDLLGKGCTDDDPDCLTKIGCFDGCKYDISHQRSMINSIMRNHISEPFSLGLVSERAICRIFIRNIDNNNIGGYCRENFPELLEQ